MDRKAEEMFSAAYRISEKPEKPLPFYGYGLEKRSGETVSHVMGKSSIMAMSEGGSRVTSFPTEERQRKKGKTLSRGADARTLAEAVIFQCMEDLWDPEYCEESRRFFLSEGFVKWAEIACLSLPQQMKLIRIVTGNERPSSRHDKRKERMLNDSENTGR